MAVPRPIRSLLPATLVWKGTAEAKTVFLTFDDGPTPGLTGQILDILDEYRSRATFFCVGENVSRYPALYNEILSMGHAAGNHTHRHLQGWKTGAEEYFEDVEKASQFIHSGFFRPPYGRITGRQVRLLKDQYRIIMWTLLSRDFDPSTDPVKNLEVMKRKTSPGAIVVFHDNLKAAKNMLHMLPAYLTFLLEEGYRVEPLNAAFPGGTS